MVLIRRFVSDDSGATAIEYGLIAALMAVGCIAAFTAFGGSLAGLFQHIQERSSDAMDDAFG